MKSLLLAFALLLASAPAMADNFTLTLDTAKTKTAISPLVYGQFIEHLGRSVYGGIWAEMIEDRKFCFPITGDSDFIGTTEDKSWNSGPYPYLKASPWRVLGPQGSVTMDREHPYVGEHSPVIHVNGAAAGISQGGRQMVDAKIGGLAVVAGKKYTGHIILAAGPEVGAVTVSLGLYDVSHIDQTITPDSADFKSYPLEFTAPSSADTVSINITAHGKGDLKIGAISLMPADNVHGFRADTLECLKQLNSPIYRWPGGNFVSGYNWRDGINPDRDKRPPRTNPAWKNIEHNDVGIAEFMDLMNLLGAEPYIALNMGKGTIQEAADEMQYVVGAPDTPMGKLRAANGHPQPWKAQYWAVGNEMFGTWQLGYMPLDQYVQKNNAAVDALRALDPNHILVACGDRGTKGWDEGMYASCADHMDLISEHVYVKEIATDPAAHAAQLAAAIKRIADDTRKFRSAIPQLQGKDIRVCLDEWNFWYGPYVYGELGTQYHFKDTLGVAMGLHEIFRNSDIFAMANFAQTVNVLGAIKTSRTAAALEGSGVALALYRAHFGTLPLDIPQPSPDLDISAALTPDKKALTIAIVNRTKNDHSVFVSPITYRVPVSVWEIKNADPQAANTPEKPDAIKVTQTGFVPIIKGLGQVALSAPAYAIELYRFDIP